MKLRNRLIFNPAVHWFDNVHILLRNSSFLHPKKSDINSLLSKNKALLILSKKNIWLFIGLNHM